MAEALTLAIPSKGRLMEDTMKLFADAGMVITRNGNDRGYLGSVEGVENINVRFLSASEIAADLQLGRVHVGVTGEDLIREQIPEPEGRVDFLRALGYGHANVVVAVPKCWVDVERITDLEPVAVAFRQAHGRRLRVATKYLNLTRRAFAEHGVTSYRIVESLGATEGTPAAGTAEVIVDITSSGATLEANALKVLDDGVILRSEANLVSSRGAEWSNSVNAALNDLLSHLDG